MLFVVLAITIVIFFPIFIKGNAIFLAVDRKLYFNVNAFKFINILGGYIKIESKGIRTFLSSKKVIFMPYKNIFNVKEKIKPLMDYHVIELNYLLDIGSINNHEQALTFGLLSNRIFNSTSKLFKTNKPYLNLKGKTRIYHDRNVLNVFLHVKICLNLFMIILSFVKILTEKLINVLKEKRK